MKFSKCYVTEDFSTLIRCSICKRHMVKNVSRHFKIQSIVRFKVKCVCGNTFIVELERRKQYRKSTNLFGSYESHHNTNYSYFGFLVVRDLSKTGIKLEIADTDNASPGDTINIRFYLDNDSETLISEKVIVKHKHLQYLGAEFETTDNVHQILNSYLKES